MLSKFTTSLALVSISFAQEAIVTPKPIVPVASHTTKHQLSFTWNDSYGNSSLLQSVAPGTIVPNPQLSKIAPDGVPGMLTYVVKMENPICAFLPFSNYGEGTVIPNCAPTPTWFISPGYPFWGATSFSVQMETLLEYQYIPSGKINYGYSESPWVTTGMSSSCTVPVSVTWNTTPDEQWVSGKLVPGFNITGTGETLSGQILLTATLEWNYWQGTQATYTPPNGVVDCTDIQ